MSNFRFVSQMNLNIKCVLMILIILYHPPHIPRPPDKIYQCMTNPKIIAKNNVPRLPGWPSPTCLGLLYVEETSEYNTNYAFNIVLKILN